MKQILINNHTEPNRRLIRGQLSSEHIFGFCIFFKKIIKRLGFELDLRASNRKQDILYTTVQDKTVDVTNNSIHLYIPTIILSPKTQKIVHEAISKTLLHHMSHGKQIENQWTNLETFK